MIKNKLATAWKIIWNRFFYQWLIQEDSNRWTYVEWQECGCVFLVGHPQVWTICNECSRLNWECSILAIQLCTHVEQPSKLRATNTEIQRPKAICSVFCMPFWGFTFSTLFRICDGNVQIECKTNRIPKFEKIFPIWHLAIMFQLNLSCLLSLSNRHWTENECVSIERCLCFTPGGLKKVVCGLIAFRS